jgi:hypothetical protein
VVRPSSQNPQPTAAPSTVTVTVSGAAPTCPARTTVTLPGKETTLTVPGAGQVTTVTVPASTITVTVPTTVAQSASTITVPGEGVTITIPGEGEVVTVTVPTTVAQPASTITVPGEDVTITVPTTLAGEVVTITVPTTLAGEVVTVPTTLAGDVITVPTTLAGEVITVTVPTTLAGDVITITVPTTLAGEIVTVPTTLAGEVVTVTATPLPASTVTVTETSTATPTSPGGFQCSATSGSNAIMNPGFENTLSGSWVSFTSSPGDIAERQALGADGSSFSFRSRISSTNSNTPQRLLQSVSLCPGTTYRLTFQARRATTAGSISVIGYAGVAGTAASPLVGGLVSSSVFQSAPEILGTITVPSGSAPVSALVYLDITFSGGTGSAKEVAIDNVNLVVV